MRSIMVSILLVPFLLANAYGQDDELFQNYRIAEADREYVRKLNQAFDESPLRFPLPPIADSADTPERLSRIYSLGFAETPLGLLLSTYTDISGLDVPDKTAMRPTFSYVPHRLLTGEEVLRIIGRLLADKGLELVKVTESSSRIIAIQTKQNQRGLPPLIIPITPNEDVQQENRGDT